RAAAPRRGAHGSRPAAAGRGRHAALARLRGRRRPGDRPALGLARAARLPRGVPAGLGHAGRRARRRDRRAHAARPHGGQGAVRGGLRVPAPACVDAHPAGRRRAGAARMTGTARTHAGHVSHASREAWKGNPMADLPDVDLEVLTAIASGTHHDPHTVLGPHLLDGPWAVVRTLRPLADEVVVTTADDEVTATHQGAGVWAAVVPAPEGADG